jgi:hypothetical protein
MIDKAQNKALDPAQNVTVTAKSGIVNEYHFAGAPDYLPLSVVANTIEEATAIWEKKRVPVTAMQTANEPVVEIVKAPTKESNDE